jgi:hypothetical protein
MFSSCQLESMLMEANCFSLSSPDSTERRTTSFIDISTEAGILLSGNGASHAMTRHLNANELCFENLREAHGISLAFFAFSSPLISFHSLDLSF